MAFLIDEAEILKPEHYFDLSSFGHKDIFGGVERVWDILEKMDSYIERWIEIFKQSERFWRSYTLSFHRQNIFRGGGTRIFEAVSMEGPVIIGRNCRIGPFTHLRGPVIIGDDCVVGNFTEIKNSILLNGARARHHNYIGDSIVGNNVNLGSGVELANYKLGGGEIFSRIRSDFMRSEIKIKTGRDKFGAVIGDRTEIGCNSVLAPGTLVGKDVYIDSLTNVNIYIPPMSKVKPKEKMPFEIEPRLK